MRSHIQLGIDSQCLSYVIEAMDSTCRLQKTVAEQQLALIRLFFYLPETLWVTPTVTLECACIRNTKVATLHKSFINVLFGEIPLHNPMTVQSRAKALQSHHTGEKGCLVLAEAEDVDRKVLLTFDSKFVNHLSSHSNVVTLVRPAEYWTSLEIPHGQRPDKIPHSTNPQPIKIGGVGE